MNGSQAPVQDAVVIGGGIVGVCCALYLQREGYRVILVDPPLPATARRNGVAGRWR
ncbi:FAD-dependent oxidoreductase [Pseudomonas aeruginosa]|nr:FAD-dependent oxidoreductase [Pseudomonas aeruginosa]MDF5923904.1 FAD-dependent oxidoreductase [Pseudomonas aeruginosa]